MLSYGQEEETDWFIAFLDMCVSFSVTNFDSKLYIQEKVFDYSIRIVFVHKQRF